MNRLLLLSLLGLSLAANAALLLGSRNTGLFKPAGVTAPPAQTAVNSSPTPTIGSPAQNDAATSNTAKTRGATWRLPHSDDDYRALAAELRAAGFPPRLVYRVLADLHLQQALAASPLAKAPYWQRLSVEQSKEMREVYRNHSAQIDALLGTDAHPSIRLSAIERKRKYGSLSDEKIDAIVSIERDYQEMQSDVYSSSGTISFDDYGTKAKQTKLLTAEKISDLAKILTPAELAEYQLHNSQSARQIATIARDVTLTAEEFAALTQIREAYDTASPVVIGTYTAEQIQQRQAAQKAYYEQLRTTLADDRFYDILSRSDPSYRAIASLSSQYPSVTPTAAYQALQLYSEVQQTMRTLSRSKPSAETVQATYAKWNAQLDTLLGPEAAAAYRKTSWGRPFVLATQRPTPPRN